MLRLRSWASSMMIVSYLRRSRSRCELGEQDAVGHQLDPAGLARAVGEADLVADDVAELGAELLGDPLGHRPGGDAARLGVADQLAAPAGPARGRARGRSSAAAWSSPSRSRRRR